MAAQVYKKSAAARDLLWRRINTRDPNDSTCGVATVSHILNRGALHYTIGMRGFYLSIPLSLWMFGPIWMLTGSVILIVMLGFLDREP